MKSIRQLARRPVKSVLGVLLIALSSLALCLGVGQYWASAQTRAAIEAQYTTVAVATDKYKWSELRDENGKIISRSYSSVQPKEVREYIASLPKTAPGCVSHITENRLANGICAGVTPIAWDNILNPYIGDGGFYPQSEPYNSAILAFQLDSVGEVEIFTFPPVMRDGVEIAGGDKAIFVELSGTVTQVVALHPDYNDPTGYRLNITLTLDDENDLEDLDLEIGETYLVYSTSYSDLDMTLRKDIAGLINYHGANIKPEDVSWDNIDYDISRYGEDITDQYVALYNGGRFLSQYDIDCITACSVYNIYVNPAHGYNEWYAASMTEEEYIERYHTTTVERVAADIETTLNSSELWSRALDCVEQNNHAFPILVTDRVGALAEFAAEKTFVTEGRSFTDEEYRHGSPVCLISETIAVKNGLEVGDTIDISFYEPESWRVYSSNPGPSDYFPYNGITLEPTVTDKQTVTVVGLYRQTEEWSQYAFSFTPNTIIMPKNSVHCETESNQDGVFSTIVLHNGTQDRMEELAAQAGWEGLFDYYDQGYSDIKDSLGGYDRVGATVLLIGLGVWLGILLLFLLLFPAQMKRETVRMWSLGTPAGLIFRHVFLSGGGLALVGTALAAIAGLFSMQRVLERLTAAADTESILPPAPWQTVLLCLLALAAELCALALCAARAAAGAKGKEG